MSDQEIIKKYGRNDGNDEDRLTQAKILSGNLDKPVWIMFEGLINLEDKGLIKLHKQSFKIDKNVFKQ